MGLVLSNAQVIYTDPENSDCDDDDLLDGQEISIDGGKSKTVKVGSADGGYITYSTVVFKYSSDPNNGDTDGDGILDVNDSKPCDPYLCTGIWTASDEKFSTTVQVELLKLELAWHLAVTDTDKIDIANRADEIRDIMSSGKGRILDIAKSISGAASDEFAWFLGGDVSAYELSSKTIYSIASSPYADFLNYTIDEETLRRYSFPTILAHCFYEITSYGFEDNV